MKVKIVIVDDNSEMITSVKKQILEDNSVEFLYGVTQPEKLLRTLEIHKDTLPEVILMDIQMPVLSGFEASQKIRALESNGKRVPIVAVTAKTVKGIQENCLEFGMDDYVTKPLVLDTLKNVFVKYLTKDKSSLGISSVSN